MNESAVASGLPQGVFAIAIFIFAFLLGSVPFGLIISRIFKVKDLQKKGSGNIGATNVSRVVGVWPAGFITLILDVAKGIVPILIATPEGLRLISMTLGQNGIPPIQFNPAIVWGTGFFAVLGHCFSPWVNFQGGKGVATGLGVILVLSPVSALAGVVAFVLTFFHRKIASLASISGLIVASVTYLVLNTVGLHLCIGAAMIWLILVRHEANIDALLENREKPFA